ncbi:phospholipid N-methyltransferase [Neolewinella xylanilytica]|uniref:Phospholipid N-methyltransferase n=1 Tax=Neolewinella xylanilytica TaxID=1514080 RepID=A0A2S6I8S4_9BACT|nr:methyltransferase domain-containing protein [Neolewinella xylanilytica]PPK87904.1 phospholipid N-methyltransferase [Neolewinella xylanilytica]
MSTLSFLLEGLRNIGTTGTITRSSPALCTAAIDRIDFATARTIVELGAGDGVITRHILERLHPDGKVIAFEVSEDLCDDMRAIGDPRLVVAQDSAEHIRFWLDKIDADLADHVVSAIPFAALPPELGNRIVNAARDNLRSGGCYNQVHYSLKTKSYYERAFGKVEAKRIYLNLPPAWVLYCKK